MGKIDNGLNACPGHTVSSLQATRAALLPRVQFSPPCSSRCHLGRAARILSLIPHSLFPLCIMRDRLGRSLQRQSQRPRCPLCSKHFINILRHLNHRQSKCASWFNTTAPCPNQPRHFDEWTAEDDTTDSPIPNHFSDIQRPLSPSFHQPHPHHIEFPGAAKRYGRTLTFMDRFHNDQYSEYCTSNVYYPFSGKDERELGSLLLSSGLLMSKINTFLSLKMVIPQPSFVAQCADFYPAIDPGCWCLILHSEGLPRSSRVAPQCP